MVEITEIIYNKLLRGGIQIVGFMKNCLLRQILINTKKKRNTWYSWLFTLVYTLVIGRNFGWLIEDVGNRKPLPAIGLKLSSENHVKHLSLKFYYATQFIKTVYNCFLMTSL